MSWPTWARCTFRQVALAHGEVAPDGAQLVSGDGLLHRQPALEPMHPQHGAVEVQLVQAQADGFADPQAMAEHHHEQQVVARAVPAGLGRLQQGGEFGRGQEVLGPFMPVRGAGCPLPRLTLYTSPLGHPFPLSANNDETNSLVQFRLWGLQENVSWSCRTKQKRRRPPAWTQAVGRALAVYPGRPTLRTGQHVGDQ